MNRIVLFLAVLIAIAFLAQSKPMVNLGGDDGKDIFGSLTNNSTGNSSLNITENSSFLNLAGEDGNSLLKDLANSSDNLSAWGGALPKAPLPPKYDASSASYAKTYAILKANHGF
jgi:hypothetical protein